MAKRKTRRRTRRKTGAMHRNPAPVKYRKNRRGFTARRRGRRYRRNPETISASKPLDMLQLGAGAATGGVSMPWVANIMQLDGMTRFAFGIAYAIGLYFLYKKVMPKAALPAAAAAAGVATYELVKDKGILAGLGDDDLTADDIARLNMIREGVEGTGAVMPGVGAVYPQLGAVMPVGNSIQVFDTESSSGIGEYTDSEY